MKRITQTSYVCTPYLILRSGGLFRDTAYQGQPLGNLELFCLQSLALTSEANVQSRTFMRSVTLLRQVLVQWRGMVEKHNMQKDNQWALTDSSVA